MVIVWLLYVVDSRKQIIESQKERKFNVVKLGKQKFSHIGPNSTLDTIITNVLN